MSISRDLPADAKIVIVGGGVGGASIAYHLAQMGEGHDVVLVDRNQLTSGSTFHSAGLVGQLRGSVTLTRMMMHSVELYRTLDCGWVECGGLRLACSEERLEETRRQAGWAQTFGLPLELISADEAQERFPLMVTDGVLAASWLPTDGYLDPSLLTYALADGAREGGCAIHTNTRVTGIDVRDGRVHGVQTDRGSIAADVVVLAGGMYCAELGALAGIRVPIIPMAHEYLITQPFQERSGLPTMRDPDNLIYFREEGGGLIMGGYERNCAPWGLDGIPWDFNGQLLEEDWDRFEEITVNARMRVPVMNDITVTKLINGPEAFTPDNEFCLGESEVGGLFVAAGFCAHGLAGRGRHRQGDGGVDRRRRAAAGPLGDGHPPFRSALPLAALHPRARQGELRDLLRHRVPAPRAQGGASATDVARLRVAPRARRGVRGEVGLGAGQLVRVQWIRWRRVAAPEGLGGHALVSRDRG